MQWRFADAEAEFRKAIELNPNYPTGHQWYGEYLGTMGRFQEGLDEMRRAQQLDPLSLIINGLVGVMLRTNGQREEALDQLQKTVEMDPNFPRTHIYLAETYLEMERYEEAIDEFVRAFVLNGLPERRVNDLAQKVRNAYRADGRIGYFRALAEALDSNAPPVVRADFWAQAGEADKAFEILESALKRRDPGLLMLKTGKLKTVRSDPRFRSLLRRVGLPE